jgi:hypothetical protein
MPHGLSSARTRRGTPSGQAERGPFRIKRVDVGRAQIGAGVVGGRVKVGLAPEMHLGAVALHQQVFGGVLVDRREAKARPERLGGVDVARGQDRGELLEHARYSGNFETMMNITVPVRIVTKDQV